MTASIKIVHTDFKMAEVKICKDVKQDGASVIVEHTDGSKEYFNRQFVRSFRFWKMGTDSESEDDNSSKGSPTYSKEEIRCCR